MNNNGDNGNLFQLDKYQLAIMDQLPKVARNMRHVDELFLWVADAIIQSFNVQVLELWVAQTNKTGQFFIELRTLVYQDTSLPQHVIANNQIMQLAEYIVREQRNYTLHTVENTFPSYQANTLTRYGLNYCCSYFLKSNALLPVANTNPFAETLPTPLAATTVLFLRHPIAQNIFLAINFVLEQAVMVANSRGLLLPRATTSGQLPTMPTGAPYHRSALSPPNLLERSPQPLANSADRSSQSPMNLSRCIVHRSEDANLMTSSNPLAGSVAISNKQARRLYSAINGQKSINELCTTTGLSIKEAYIALQFLLAQHRIQIYEPDGQLVDNSLFAQYEGG